MRIQILDGEIVLSEVYNGIGIQTNMGLFGIAQRDGGIEVLLNGKPVWSSHQIPEPSRPVVDRAPPHSKDTFHRAAAASLYSARYTIVRELQSLYAAQGHGARKRAAKLQRAMQALDQARSLLDDIFFVESPESPVNGSPYYRSQL